MIRKSKGKQNRDSSFRHWQRVAAYLVAYDIVAVTLSYYVALMLRFDLSFSRVPEIYLKPWAIFAPVYAVLCVLVFGRFRLYRSIWRFASFTELQRVTAATAVTTVIQIIGSTVAINMISVHTQYNVHRMPLSYYIMGALLQFVLVTAIRFSYRFILLLRATRDKKSSNNIMLIGVHSIIGTT